MAIDPTAIIDPQAEISGNVSIGPFCHIGAGVRIAEGTVIDGHVLIRKDTVIGKNNHIYHGSVIGEDCQHRNYKQEPTQLIIGDHNIIREFCTIHRGSADGIDSEHTTCIGSHNFVMVGSHVAHDCQLGNHITIANNTALAGHVNVGDHAFLAGHTLVHQFCRLGRYSMTGINTIVTKDIPAFVKIAGNPAKAYGLNSVGMKRQGFDQYDIATLKTAYHTVYHKQLNTDEALAQLEPMAEEHKVVSWFTASIAASRRGIIRPLTKVTKSD